MPNKISDKRRLEKGLGQGIGKDYKSMYGVRDVPSLGRTHRISGQKVNRTYIVFSDGERNAFHILEWDRLVVDVREQFPLLPLEETLRIAEKLGFAHPADGNGHRVMTSDFLVTRKTFRGLIDGAYQVKTADDLENRRTIEKLQIEEAYWSELGVPWTLILTEDLSCPLSKNLRWVNSCWDLVDTFSDADATRIIQLSIQEEHNRKPSESIDLLCARVDVRLGLSPGSGLLVLKHSIAHRHCRVDMRREILLDLPLKCSWSIPSATKGA